jgi:hypothetical protein
MKKRNYHVRPYGAYITHDAVILHDRHYRPIVRALWTHVEWPSGNLVIDPSSARFVPSDEWIEHDGHRWFYSDGSAPRINKLTRARIDRIVDMIPALPFEIELREKRARESGHHPESCHALPRADRWRHAAL